MVALSRGTMMDMTIDVMILDCSVVLQEKKKKKRGGENGKRTENKSCQQSQFSIHGIRKVP